MSVTGIKCHLPGQEQSQIQQVRSEVRSRGDQEQGRQQSLRQHGAEDKLKSLRFGPLGPRRSHLSQGDATWPAGTGGDLGWGRTGELVRYQHLSLVVT